MEAATLILSLPESSLPIQPIFFSAPRRRSSTRSFVAAQHDHHDLATREISTSASTVSTRSVSEVRKIAGRTCNSS